MPYIGQGRRRNIADGWGYPKTPGELNYKLTLEIGKYLEDNGESYQTYNDILGALEGAKLELYRRRVAKYEDRALVRNGDVYPSRGSSEQPEE